VLGPKIEGIWSKQGSARADDATQVRARGEMTHAEEGWLSASYFLYEIISNNKQH